MGEACGQGQGSGSLYSAAARSTHVGSRAMNGWVTLQVDFNLHSNAEDRIPGVVWACGWGAQLVERATLTPLSPTQSSGGAG